MTPYDSDVLVNQGRALVDYFVELADACGDGRAASNWVQQDVLRWLGEHRLDIGRYPFRPGRWPRSSPRFAAGPSSQPRPRSAGRDGLHGKIAGRGHAALGVEEVDDWAILGFAASWSRPNPKIAAEVREGKLKGLGALVGQAKKENPNVNPTRVRELCFQLISEGQT